MFHSVVGDIDTKQFRRTYPYLLQPRAATLSVNFVIHGGKLVEVANVHVLVAWFCLYCRSCLRKISVGVHVVRRNLAELKIMRDSYILFLHYDMQAIHTSKIDFFPLVQQKNIDCFESGINMFFKNLIMIRHLFCSIGSYDTVCSSQCSLLTI